MAEKQQTKTLQEFLEQYLTNRKAENTPLSYQDWAEKEGALYRDELADAAQEYMRTRPGYGAQGEALAQSGLSGSGYAGYLEGAAYAAYQNRRGQVGAEMRRDWQTYRQKTAEERDRLLQSTVGKLYSMGIRDAETAGQYGVLMGLSEEDSKVAAAMAATLAEAPGSSGADRDRVNMISNMLTWGLQYDTMVSYAMQCGYSREDAVSIADTAWQMVQEMSRRYNNQNQ